MAENRKTPIMLITGSLGSGKTTLLRRILDAAPFRIAVLMNEFGELAIDSRVISGENIDVIELAGGCVCCSMTGEFEAAVREIIEKLGADLIVVEATGVAESDSLVLEVEDNLPEVRLDSVICITDAYLSIRHPHVGYTLRTQIASADVILVNKIDLVTEAEVKAVEDQVRKHNDHAAILRTVNCAVDTELLFGQVADPRPRPTLLFSGQKMESFSWSTEKILDSAKYQEFVEGLPEEVIRSKGFVRFEGGSRLFNYVVGRADFEPFDADRTELVFIGSNLDVLRPEIVNRLMECEVD